MQDIPDSSNIIEAKPKVIDYNKRWYPAAFILVVSLIILVWWVGYMANCDNAQSYDGMGQIGDTIGGLTSPIIGLIGAILIYVSFQEQIKANKIQIEALEKDRIRYSQEVSRIDSDRWYDYQYNTFKELKAKFYILDFSFKDKTFSGYRALIAATTTLREKANREWTIDEETAVLYFVKYLNVHLNEWMDLASTIYSGNLRYPDSAYQINSEVEKFYVKILKSELAVVNEALEFLPIEAETNRNVIRITEDTLKVNKIISNNNRNLK